MKRIYLAGPYRAPGDHGQPNLFRVCGHVHTARHFILAVHEAAKDHGGALPICPHTMWHGLDGALPDDVFLAWGLELLEACDAVLMMPGWRDSAGTRAERDRAWRLRIPILEDLPRLRQWLRERAIRPPALPITRCTVCGLPVDPAKARLHARTGGDPALVYSYGHPVCVRNASDNFRRTERVVWWR
jgi:hypothetical protein